MELFSPSVPENYRIRLHGGDADNGQLQTTDLTAALHGLQTSLRLSASSYLFGHAVSDRTAKPADLRLYLVGARRGTFILDVAANYSGELLLLSTVAAYNKRKEIFRFLKNMIRSHLKVKESLEVTKANAIEQIRLLVAQASMNMLEPHDVDVDREFVNDFDQAVRNIAKPLRHNVSITISQGDSPDTLVLSGNDRIVANRPFEPSDYPVGLHEVIEADVKLIRIHRDTRNGMMEFVAIYDPRFERLPSGHRYCVIKDSALDEPGDPYTLALHKSSSIRVEAWLEPHPFRIGSTRWAIRLRGRISSPLFERLAVGDDG